jgi:two-component system, cell cycle sensor histidine kinase and response regulator CckA
MATPVTGRSDKLSDVVEPRLRTIMLAQKSQLLEELAQAMGNRFNNIMMAVTSYAELELKKVTGKERRNLEQLFDHATRATYLIQKLLNVTHSGIGIPQAVDLDRELVETSSLLRELLGENIELEIKSGADSAVIHIDCAELEQILFALVVAARKAINRRGKVVISTSLGDLGYEFLGSEFAQPGKYLGLSVESYAEERASADPSARESSEMSNLSLVAVRQIIERCHGLARLTIKASGEASFKVYFPLKGHVPVNGHGLELPRNPALPRTILVVEDDDAVRVPAVEFLMMEGFKVLQARTGKDALHIVQQSRSSLDLLVTDIFMPKMSGHEVAHELMAQHPELKVLYISGDPGRSAQQGGTDTAQNATLRKPFRLNVLRDKIHDLLGE